MTAGEFALGLLRLAAIVLPVLGAAHTWRIRYFDLSGSIGALTEAVLALSALLVGAEILGSVSLDWPATLIPLFFVVAAASRVAGRYRYVVLTPAPTAPIPLAWTQSDAAARLILHPTTDDFVFEMVGRLNPAM
jgi:hypothetical protein